VTATVAAVDCGTNSVRLLVAEVDGEGRMRITRLGEGVDRTGALDPQAVERTIAVIEDYARTVRGLGTERVRVVATSAVRDAANRELFVGGVRAALGVDPEVITGEEEARLSFLGATRELRHADGGRPPYLVVDIVGGFTEFVLGDEVVQVARSVDIGCVRLTERHLRAAPPSAAQVEAAVRDIDAALDDAGTAIPFDRTGTLIGLAGSVTTVGALALGLADYDRSAIHGSRVARETVHAVSRRLLAMTRDEIAALPAVHPGRVDVIGAGALVLREVVRAVGTPDAVASEHDILDGIALSLLSGGAV
jgi:exopolyphosphatase/guanosine-5'-triphosphate,3'-diphosphate pyrophosphatase